MRGSFIMALLKKIFSSNTLLLAFLLAGTFLIYQPGLYGDYIFDDLSNITNNAALEIKEFSWQAIYEAAISSFSGPLKRPVSMLTFAFNASTTGFDAPLFFKLTGLLVHLGTGLAVYWLAGLLLARFRQPYIGTMRPSAVDWTRLLITGIWLLHPLNLSVVLYIVQRMTSLAALFSFLAVAMYCKGRQRLEVSSPLGWLLIAVAFVVWLPLAVLSKENGILIPALVLVVEITAFDFRKLDRENKIRLGVLGFIAVAIPAFVALVATITWNATLMGSYYLRDFDLTQRLLTQARVLWFYIGLTLAPQNSTLGLFHDDFATSTGLLLPVTTLLSCAGLVFLLVAAFYSKRRFPVITFGILWFFAGHLLESTVLPLEMVHEHRNYLPIFGLIFAGCFMVLERFPANVSKQLLVSAVVAYMMLLAAITLLRAERWGDSVTHAVNEVENHPDSERAQQQLGRTFMLMMIDTPKDEYYLAAKEALEKCVRLTKINVTAHFSLLQLAYLIEKPIAPEIVDAAVRVLSEGPLPPATAQAFRTLIDCQLFAYCKLPDSDVIRLANAALTNPRGTTGVTTQIAIFLAQYYIDKIGDGDLAVLTLKNALERNPESTALHLSAGRVYRVVGDFARAVPHLAEAARLGAVGTYRIEIAEEQQKLKRDYEKSHK